MNYNVVCDLSHFEDPTLRDIMSQVFPGEADRRSRKHWEIAQAVRALTGLIKKKGTPRLLGVGAGLEHTSFYMTRWPAEVHATDLYGASAWGTAPAKMLINPGECAPGEYDRQRLIVQHMDGRDLRYPDSYFDGVFSSSAIEHFGTVADIQQAAREIGRVLKPGGIAALATEFCIDAKPDKAVDNLVIFDEDLLREAVIEPSGCTRVDALEYAVSDDTRQTQIDLKRCVIMHQQGKPLPLPHVVVEHDGWIFTSVMVVLRK
jgi:SAM-dependent methyltransferase